MLYKKHLTYTYIILSFLVLILTLGILISFGQPLMAASGNIYLWSSAGGADYSQHISDWYSFSHFLHGIAFFAILTYFFRNTSLYMIFFISVCIESAWEILENTPMVIERYRQSGIAAGYFGDSVLNSFFDIIFMMLGFLFIQRFGAKVSLIAFLFLEIFTMYMIRDGLLLNVIMLIHPFDTISQWQAGA